jgi:hypothetical protein
MGGIELWIYGYACVSTDGQTLDAQADQLLTAAPLRSSVRNNEELRAIEQS